MSPLAPSGAHPEVDTSDEHQQAYAPLEGLGNGTIVSQYCHFGQLTGPTAQQFHQSQHQHHQHQHHQHHQHQNYNQMLLIQDTLSQQHPLDQPSITSIDQSGQPSFVGMQQHQAHHQHHHNPVIPPELAGFPNVVPALYAPADLSDTQYVLQQIAHPVSDFSPPRFNSSPSSGYGSLQRSFQHVQQLPGEACGPEVFHIPRIPISGDVLPLGNGTLPPDAFPTGQNYMTANDATSSELVMTLSANTLSMYPTSNILPMDGLNGILDCVSLCPQENTMATVNGMSQSFISTTDNLSHHDFVFSGPVGMGDMSAIPVSNEMVAHAFPVQQTTSNDNYSSLALSFPEQNWIQSGPFVQSPGGYSPNSLDSWTILNISPSVGFQSFENGPVMNTDSLVSPSRQTANSFSGSSGVQSRAWTNSSPNSNGSYDELQFPMSSSPTVANIRNEYMVIPASSVSTIPQQPMPAAPARRQYRSTRQDQTFASRKESSDFSSLANHVPPVANSGYVSTIPQGLSQLQNPENYNSSSAGPSSLPLQLAPSALPASSGQTSSVLRTPPNPSNSSSKKQKEPAERQEFGPQPPPTQRRKATTEPARAGVAKRRQSTQSSSSTGTTTSSSTSSPEKKVGRRKGPLRPDQRQQAHEIRKRRACLRCKFLKKTCNTGDPCKGCKPTHARLWQVPCTRIDIRDLGYFLSGWTYDYERHASMPFPYESIGSVSPSELSIKVSHGYGVQMELAARYVFFAHVVDHSAFDVKWSESKEAHTKKSTYHQGSPKLCLGINGIPSRTVSLYLSALIADDFFESWVDRYFQGTLFVTDMLKSVHRYYRKTRTPIIETALKMVVAYAMATHVTFIEGLPEADMEVGKVLNSNSRAFGLTVAPVLVNHHVKRAFADMWRQLMKEVLTQLSTLFASVYNGEKLKNWPTIFVLCTLLLTLWEFIQFDCHYKVSDENETSKFIQEMEGTPIGVIVGLFVTISHQVPSFVMWDKEKNRGVLQGDDALDDMMEETSATVRHYEDYLRTRQTTEFDRNDMDSLSSSLLCRLVIRT